MRSVLRATWYKTDVPKSQENFITQVAEEIGGRVTKKLAKEFSWTENRILGTLSQLDEFLLDPLIQGHSGSAPETSRTTPGTNQGTNEHDSQSDPHPEASISRKQTTRNFGPEDGHDTCLLQFLGIGILVGSQCCVEKY